MVLRIRRKLKAIANRVRHQLRFKRAYLAGMTRLQRVPTGRRVHIFRQHTSGVSQQGQFIGGASTTQNTFVQALTPQNISYYFCLSDLPQANTFTALFDQYRFRKVIMTMYPVAQQVVQGTASAVPIGAQLASPNMLTVIDYDDANALASYLNYQEYETCKVHNTYSMRKIVRTVKPHVAQAMYQGAFAGYGNKSAQWIDSGSPLVQHFGIKIYIPACATATAVQAWNVDFVYEIEFKNVR